MNRRSMLGFLGLAPTLGAAVAKDALSGGGQLARPMQDIAYNRLSPGMYAGDSPKPMDFMEKSSYQLQAFTSAQEEYKKLTQGRDEWIANVITTEIQNLKWNPRFDYDILAMKSISDVAKVRMQARRNAEKNYECNEQSLATRIKDYLNGKDIW